MTEQRSEGAAMAAEARLVRRVGVLTHPRIPETNDIAADLAWRLAALGVSSEVDSRLDTGPLAEQLATFDCLITLGGDGTIVRAARAVAGTPVPVLGVNLGQLGFLAELQPSELTARMEALARGEFRVEERSLLRATLSAGDAEPESFDALNDAVVARGEKVRVIAVAVSIDGQPFATYRADGVIVATATGSTAYSLSVGGPIVAPTLGDLIIVPMAPHLVPTRALVVPGSSAVRLLVCAGYQAVLSVDGQVDRALSGGDVVNITQSPNRVGFVRFGPPADFYGTLFRRLRWVAHRQ